MTQQSANQIKQGNSTDGNGSQVQREMPFFSALKEPELVDHALVETCRDELMAINRCMDLSGLANEVLADSLGIDPGHFSRIRRGRGHFPTKLRLKLMYLCGNKLPSQYEAWRMGDRLEPISKDEKIRRLERELADAKRAA